MLKSTRHEQLKLLECPHNLIPKSRLFNFPLPFLLRRALPAIRRFKLQKVRLAFPKEYRIGNPWNDPQGFHGTARVRVYAIIIHGEKQPVRLRVCVPKPDNTL